MQIKSQIFGQLSNNCYLITDEETNKSALIDCTEYSQKMIDFIGDADLQYILLTHGHFDHIGGVADVKEKYGAKVAISIQDEEMLSSTKKSLGAYCGVNHKSVEADILLMDNDTIMLGNTKIEALLTPGHTKGGICYLVNDVIFSGDTLFKESCGRTDFPGGSAQDMKSSLDRLANLKGDYTVYTGHGPSTTLNYERQNNQCMR